MVVFFTVDVNNEIIQMKYNVPSQKRRMKGSRSISCLQYRHRVFYEWSHGLEYWSGTLGRADRRNLFLVSVAFSILFCKERNCSQHHFLVSLINFYITSGSVVMPSGHFREYILHLTMASRWLHDIVKPSHTIHINIVCKTTTSCIVRDCIGYNRVPIVCPSVGFVHASAQHWLFTKFVTKIARN